MTSHTRRAFMRQSIGLATSVSFATAFIEPAPLFALVGEKPEPVPPIDDPRLKQLVQRALDSARSAGAGYADVRLTHTRTRQFRGGQVKDSESITVGVRVLADGYWGFASGPVWSADEMARLGGEATRLAKTNALGKPRVTELAARPVVNDAHWTMPVAIDPFTVHPSQFIDMLLGINEFAKRRPYGAGAALAAMFIVQDKSFGSSDGSYFTQRTYRSSGSCGVGYRESMQRQGQAAIEGLSPAGVGYELFNENAMRAEVERVMEEIKADFDLPIKPVDVGRFDAVMPAAGVAQLLSSTIGAATELDRALGYEANAGGTSYLNDPLEMLGQYQVGAPLLSVAGNRNDPGGAATVAWDDEAVAPTPFPIVSNGLVMDYHTTRESSNWIREYYTKVGRPPLSHGCAYAPDAVSAPLAHTANLVMTPGVESHTFDSLVANLEKGVAFKDVSITVDFQKLTGLIFVPGVCYEIARGKKVARLVSAGAQFRAPELWKSIRALGGSQSLKTYGQSGAKGEPAQSSFHSVTAVPVMFEKLAIIDPRRKA